MTKPTISVGDVSRFCEVAGIKRPGLGTVDSAALSNALADFLARRVPDARDAGHKDDEVGYCNAGFNACRDMVLRGGK